MDYKVMKRPMFKMGGPTSGGTGITSGLDTPRQNYQGAGSVMSIEDAVAGDSKNIFEQGMIPLMLKNQSNYESMRSLPKLQAIGSIATNVLPNIERGGLKGIVDILKDPNTINAAIQGLSQTKKLDLDREKQKLADLGAIFKGKTAIEQAEMAEKKLESDMNYKLEDIRIKEINANKETATEIKIALAAEAEAMKENGIVPPERQSEFDSKMKIALGSGFITKAEAGRIANEMVLKAELASGENFSKSKRQRLIDSYASSIYFYGQRQPEAEGGRIGKAMGGGFDMGQGQPMQAAQTMAPGPEMMPIGPGPEQMPQAIGEDPFTILRQRLPQEISDEVVSLIAYNKIAFQDFANIQDQDDVDLFNQKYNVQLVVDMASR